MNPLKALKQRLALRFAKSTQVKQAVLAQLEEDSIGLAKLGKKPAVFEQILEGAAVSEAAVTRIIDHPDVLNRILRSPKVFERLLSEVSTNPESLYRALQQRNVRKNLSAQNEFLQKIAHEKQTLEEILRNVPPRNWADAIEALLGENVNFLRDLGDAPTKMAAALLYRESGSGNEAERMTTSDKIILEGVIDSLGAQAPKVVLEMVQNDPSLFRDGPLRDQAISSIVSDEDSLSKMCALFVVNPKNGASLGARAQKLFKRVLSEPVFVQAMIQHGPLRMSLLHIVEDSATAANDTVPDMLAEPRIDVTENA